MPAKVLLAFATTYGSTQEVAEAVATTLREQRLEVDVQLAREVRSLAGYGAVVLGAALYAGHWHKEAKHFLEQHRGELQARPVAVFALGPLHPDEKEVQGAHQQLDKELAKYPWLKPVALEVFVGKFDPAKLQFPVNLFMGRMPASDLRDWTAIRAWAGDLAAQLQPALSQAAQSVQGN